MTPRDMRLAKKYEKARRERERRDIEQYEEGWRQHYSMLERHCEFVSSRARELGFRDAAKITPEAVEYRINAAIRELASKYVPEELIPKFNQFVSAINDADRQRRTSRARFDLQMDIPTADHFQVYKVQIEARASTINFQIAT